MNSNPIYGIGDKVQTGDGRIGIVIDTDRTPVTQNPVDSQTIVVKFPDQSTLEGRAENFKAISDKPFGNVGPS